MSYDTIIKFGVPPTLFLMMFIVGLELVPADFKKVLKKPRVLILAVLAQVVGLPLIGVGLVKVLDVTGALAGGVLLILACPNGGMANMFVFLARGKTALSISSTTLTGLLALLALPVTLHLVNPTLDAAQRFHVPVGQMIGQLALLIGLPVVLGMIVRRKRPSWADERDRLLRAIVLVAVLIVVVLVMLQNASQFAAQLQNIFVLVVILTLVTVSFGYVLGWLLRAESSSRITLALVFPVRNLALAITIAVTMLGRSEFAVFGTAYFVMQVPILMLAVAFFRVRAGKRQSVNL